MKCNLINCTDKTICDLCYITYRLKSQIKWYDEKAISYKRHYNIITFFIVIISTLVPILAAVDSTKFKYFIIALSAVDTILISFNKIFKFQELWIEYRNIHRLLEIEFVKFIELTSPYNDLDFRKNKEHLVASIEYILNIENSKWKGLMNNNFPTPKK